MKTAEELITLKNEVEALNKKLAELTKEELEQISGGMDWLYDFSDCGLKNLLPGKPCPFSPIIRERRNCDGCTCIQ